MEVRSLQILKKEEANPEVIFEELCTFIGSYLPNQDLSVLRKAYDFAASAHKEQMRKSGELYITHPLNVALITANLRIDLSSVVAALLHDVVEDTVASLDDIEKNFGKEIADIVDGLTKISKIEFRSNHERLAENFRKMVVAMAKDIRVILIKIADRLHNMRTLKALNVQKRQRIAQETMDIYAPIASRLGIYAVKSELEDLCLRQLKPEVYEEIKQKVQLKKAARESKTEEVRQLLTEELIKYGFKNFFIAGRAKHFNSIYKKMLERNLAFEDLHDLFAFRIIVDNVKDCYEALGVVHAMWKPMPGRFKDYIAMPKANLYQSLHTTVIRPNGEPAEIQIRTKEMHEICEYGIAAHWNYKERGSTVAGPNSEVQKLSWLRQIIEWQKEIKDPNEFLEAVKVDLFEEEIFIFTPKGDVIPLPTGATALDFAFGVHSHIGSTMIGAKVNGTMVPMKKSLKSGDIVEILTSPKQKPTKDWLGFVTTSKAKNRIRSYLRHEQRDRSLTLGKNLLEQRLEERSLDLDKIQKTGELDKLVKIAHEANSDDLYSAIGYGKVDAKEIIEKCFPKKLLQKSLESTEVIELDKGGQGSKSKKPRGILVSGMDHVLVSFARCCNPLPGEEIIGFVTRGKGVTIHRYDCARAIDIDPQRRVDVGWGNAHTPTEFQADFLTYIKILARDRSGILADITLAISHLGANIMKAQVQVGKDLMGHLDFEVKVKSHQQLQMILGKIEGINSVIKVERKSAGFSTLKKKHKKK